MEADLAYPLNVMLRGDSYFILDGVHRLLKAVMLGVEALPVRQVGMEDLQRMSQAR